MIAVVILFLLSGIAHAFHDGLSFNLTGLKSWGPFFDNSESWKRKYKDGDSTKGQKFFGSTTFLVGFTDAWHFSQMLCWLFADIAVLYATHLNIWIIAAITGRRLIFEPVYAYIRKR